MLIVASDTAIVGNVITFVVAALLLGGAIMLIRGLSGVDGERTLVAPSILVLLVASVVALFAWPRLRTQGFCDVQTLGGANIAHAVELALLCGVAGAVALRTLRSNPRDIAVVMLVAAVLLSACMALVWFDSAVYPVRWFASSGDMFDCPYEGATTIHRVWFLYPVWGSAVALLLLQAGRAFRYARAPRESETGSGEKDEGD
jgi:hypothetical protein